MQGTAFKQGARMKEHAVQGLGFRVKRELARFLCEGLKTSEDPKP